HQGTEPGALGAARGKSIRQALVGIEARAPIDADHFHGEAGACRNGTQMQRTMPGMLEQIRRQLRRHERHAAGIGLIETQLAGHAVRNAPGVANLALLLDRQYQRLAAANIQDHLAMLMRVPAPGELSRSNSSTSRLAPVSPSPRPPPEVQPSVIASLISAIPGPSSRNGSRMPDLGPSANGPQSLSRPPRWTTVLRASSPTAVTGLVCSTRRMPQSCASFRTIWRAITSSCSMRTGTLPLARSIIFRPS